MKLNHHSFQAASAFAAALATVSLAACTSTTTSATAPSTSKCQVSAAATPLQFTAGGGTGQLTITVARDCTWSIDSPAGWLAVNGERAGNGSATLTFTVAGNPAPAVRSADLLVDEVRVAVTQAAAPCSYSLNRTSDSIGAAGGTLSVDIATLTGCGWTASSAASWLTPARASGQSSSSVQIAVEPNTGAARRGDVTLGGRNFTVAQAAGETPTPAPAPAPTPSPSPTPPPAPAPDPSDPVSLSGTVSALSGSCPSLRFRVDGRDVATDRDTDFSGRGRGRCRDLSNGDTVVVTGLSQPSGLVLAFAVEFSRR